MNKAYEKYFPDTNEVETIGVQGNIPKKLHEQVNALKPRKMTWSDFLTGLMTKFVDDNANTKKASNG